MAPSANTQGGTNENVRNFAIYNVASADFITDTVGVTSTSTAIIRALAGSPGRQYFLAGGDFETAIDTYAKLPTPKTFTPNRIFYYDNGTEKGILTLGRGVGGQVFAIAISGNDVYVGGNFSEVAGFTANNIARWNNSTKRWYLVGQGVNSTVYAVKWNSSSRQWESIGSGTDLNGPVYAFAEEGSGATLFVGGEFTQVGSTSVGRVARYSLISNSWYTSDSTFNAGIGTNPGDVVRALAYDLGWYELECIERYNTCTTRGLRWW